jgi:hypothetical protein
MIELYVVVATNVMLYILDLIMQIMPNYPIPNVLIGILDVDFYQNNWSNFTSFKF